MRGLGRAESLRQRRQWTRSFGRSRRDADALERAIAADALRFLARAQVARLEPDDGVRDEIKIDVVKARGALNPGREGAQIAASGSNLKAVARVGFGEGVNVKDFNVSEKGVLVATVNIDKEAKPGPRKMEVWNKASERFEKDNAITIAAQKTTPDTPSGPTKKQQKKR